MLRPVPEGEPLPAMPKSCTHGPPLAPPLIADP